MAQLVFKDRLALVTGASSGLGVEFARQLKMRGARLILVARSEDKLRALADELNQSGPANTEVLIYDLSVPGEVSRLCDELEAKGLLVEHLVNNAGVGRAHAVASDDPRVLVDLVQLNCTALTELTARLLPQMVKRGSGGVIQIASAIAFSPSPYMASYAASKAYVKSFTEGLAIELEKSGVRMTAVCPGHVRTGFQVAAGFSDSAMPVPGELSAAQTVRLALRGYEKKKTVVVTGFLNQVSVMFMSLLPRSWVARISASVLRKLGRFD